MFFVLLCCFILYSNAVFCSPTPFPELYRASINWQEIMSVSQTPQSLAFNALPLNLKPYTLIPPWAKFVLNPGTLTSKTLNPQSPHKPHITHTDAQHQPKNNWQQMQKIPRPLNRKPWTSKPNTKKPWPPKPQTLTPWMPNPKSPHRPRAGAIMTTGPQLVSGCRV